MSERPMPLIGDIALDAVQRIAHQLDAGLTAHKVAGLSGEVQQRAGRPSHAIRIEGLLLGEGAPDALASLQQAAAAGEELTFAADIATALDLTKVVIHHFAAEEEAGHPHRILYRLDLAESPPLPPPAEVSGVGDLPGLGGLPGLSDLGIDPSALADIADLASEAASLADQAMGAIDALGALANLASGDLDFGGVMAPLDEATAAMPAIASRFSQASAALGAMFDS